MCMPERLMLCEEGTASAKGLRLQPVQGMAMK